MPFYAQLIVYFCSIFISFFALSNLEWAKITRLSRREFVWFSYIVISLAIGFCLASLVLGIVNIFLNL